MTDVATSSKSTNSDSPPRRLAFVPVATVRAGDGIGQEHDFQVVLTVTPVQLHFWPGPYSPVTSYAVELEASATCSAVRMIVKAGEWVAVWRVCG